jgi:hypothetical protein
VASAIGAFTYNKKMTLTTSAAGANIASSLTDFPVCVAINPTSWPTAAEHEAFFGNHNTDGKRVQFFASDQTTNLAYEVESYVNTSGSEAAIYWVKVPTVTGNSTTDVYVGYGNDPNAADQSAATGVWDSSYRGVWHLGGNSWGTSPEAKDSTANAYHATNTGTTDAAGLVGRGRKFSGTSQYITLPSDFPKTDTVATIEFMLDTKPTNKVCYWWDRSHASDIWGHFAIVQEGGYLKVAVNMTDVSATLNKRVCAYASLANGQRWTFVFNSDLTVTVYLDGAAYSTTDAMTFTGWSWAYGDATDVTVMGRAGSYAKYYFDGGFSDVRHSASARTADWEKASHFSMKATSWNGDGWLAWSAAGTNATSTAPLQLLRPRIIPAFL